MVSLFLCLSFSVAYSLSKRASSLPSAAPYGKVFRRIDFAEDHSFHIKRKQISSERTRTIGIVILVDVRVWHPYPHNP